MNIRKLFGEVNVSLDVEEPLCHFFTKGDILKGNVFLDFAKRAQLKDIEISIRCVETSAVLRKKDTLSYQRDPKVKPPVPRSEKREVHWQDVQTLTIGEKNDSPLIQEGQRKYPFSFELPKCLDNIPGSTKVSTPDGLEFSITWLLEVVVHRLGIAPKSKGSAIISVFNDIPLIPRFQEKANFSAFGYIRTYRAPPRSGLRKLRKMIAANDREVVSVSFDAGYPAIVLPQMPLSLQLSLKISCTCPGLVYLDKILINLIQRCDALAEEQQGKYVKKYEVGSIVEHRIIYERAMDLTSKVERMGLASRFPPNFETNLLRCSYELDVEISFTYLTTKRGASKENSEKISSSIPVLLASVVDSQKLYDSSKEKEFVAAQILPKPLNFRPQESSGANNKSNTRKKPILSPGMSIDKLPLSSLSNVSDATLFPPIGLKEKVISLEEFDTPLSFIIPLFVNGSSWYEKFLTDVEHNSSVSKIPQFEKSSAGEERRQYEYVKHLNASIGPRSTRCMCTDTLENLDPNTNITILTATKTPDVPNGDIFTTFTRICMVCIEKDRTKIRVSSWLEWEGKSWLRGTIEKGALNGQQVHCQLLVNHIRMSNGENIPVSQHDPISEPRRFSYLYILGPIILVIALLKLYII